SSEQFRSALRTSRPLCGRLMVRVADRRGRRPATRGEESPMCDMRRREFLGALCAAAAVSSVSWPLAARAQQSKMSVIGYLGPGSAAASASTLAVFRQSLAGAGYVEGRNIAIEYRFAEGRYDPSWYANR